MAKASSCSLLPPCSPPPARHAASRAANSRASRLPLVSASCPLLSLSAFCPGVVSHRVLFWLVSFVHDFAAAAAAAFRALRLCDGGARRRAAAKQQATQRVKQQVTQSSKYLLLPSTKNAASNTIAYVPTDVPYQQFCSVHYLLRKHALLLQTCTVLAFLGGSLCV